MRGLEELPDSTKDALLPIVHMRPWVGSHSLDRSVERLREAYGDRPVVVSIDDATDTIGSRPVHVELAELRHSAGGYDNWCRFIEGNELYIPAIQLDDLAEMEVQIRFFRQLDRGLFVILRREAFGALRQLADGIADLTRRGRDVCFVLDYGAANQEHQTIAARVVAQYQILIASCPNAFVSISASSFPMDFVDRHQQEIFERLLYDDVAGRLPQNRLIYSDRGSARAERASGGGGVVIPPRIDYPLSTEWRFYRSEDVFGFAGYNDQARRLITRRIWDDRLRVWGTLMIERTAAGDTSAITSQQRAAAVRINLHLQRQAFYGDERSLYSTEDDWDL